MRSLAAAILVLGLLPLVGCTGPVHTTPVLTLQPLAVTPAVVPVLAIAVVDRTGATDAAYANQFADSIRHAYGPAVRIVSSDAVEDGRVTLEFRIVEMGAVRNRRQSTHITLGFGTVAAIGPIGDWGKVIAAAPLRKLPVSGQMVVRRDTGQTIPNNWSGIAHVDIKVDDRRPGHSAAFLQPFYAEHIGPGNWDQLTGLSLATDAWDEIQPRIAAFLDAAMRKVISEQPPPAAPAAPAARS